MLRAKYFIVTICSICLISSAKGQLDIRKQQKHHYGIGVNGGINFGQLADHYPVNIGFDLIYLRSISSRIHLGASTGLAYYFCSTSDGKNSGALSEGDFPIIPLTFSFRVSPFKNFLWGMDIGYAASLNSEIEGGFYGSPRGTFFIGDRMPVFVGFRFMPLDENLHAVQFGIGYLLN